jgi:hypothetical protein
VAPNSQRLFKLQDGVVADRHSQTRQEPFADPAAGGMAEQSNEFANSPCFPRGRQRDRQRFGECLSSTLLVATSPAARANLQRRRNLLNWKLLQPSHLPTVPRSGSFPAARTRSTSLTLRRYAPAVPTERHPLHDNPRPKANFVVFVILQICEAANKRKIKHEK